MANDKLTFPPAVAQFVYSKVDLLQGSGRTMIRWVLLVISTATTGLSWLAMTFLPETAIRWGVTIAVMLLGAVAVGRLWVRWLRATRAQVPIVIQGRVRKKRRVATANAFQFHVQVTKVGKLARDGHALQVAAQDGETIDSMVASRGLYDVVRKDWPCSLFCLPSGQCLAAYQDNQLLW